MAKVKLHGGEPPGQTVTMTPPTPSQDAVASSIKSGTVIDKRGRSILVRSLNALEQIRFARILGEHATNPVYSMMAEVAAIVRAIDDNEFPTIPSSLPQIEAKYALLDFDGQKAVHQVLNGWVQENPESIEHAAKN